LPSQIAEKYLRLDRLPTIWCAGCGNGQVLSALLGAIDRLGLDPDSVVLVSGIGCSSRAPGYTVFDSLHTTHGRALGFATGIKMAKPDLHVIVITGDGDGAAIGGNHLIHAARRNIDLTCILFNNQTYGMTGGQNSPTAPEGSMASTAPYGTQEPAFDLCRLVTAAGATYVARGATARLPELSRLIEHGLAHKGFSFVEAISQCPVYYGRANHQRGATEMLAWQRENTIGTREAEREPESAVGKIVLGELYRVERPEFAATYRRMVAARQAGGPVDG
jgi:2-oxoglutarate/2-oxoacid ferredoxin oxidoreductase subunit beta